MTLLGTFLLFVSGALLIPALCTSYGKVVVAVVLFTAAARFGVTGLYELTGESVIEKLAGVVGLALLGVAGYASLSLAVEDTTGRTVLPVLRRGSGRQAMDGNTTDQLGNIATEAGVRKQL